MIIIMYVTLLEARGDAQRLRGLARGGWSQSRLAEARL